MSPIVDKRPRHDAGHDAGWITVAVLATILSGLLSACGGGDGAPDDAAPTAAATPSDASPDAADPAPSGQDDAQDEPMRSDPATLGKTPTDAPPAETAGSESADGNDEDKPARPRGFGTRKRDRKPPADREALRALPVSRAKELIASAREALGANNQSKAMKRADNALAILEGHVGEDGVESLEFDAKWISLQSRFQQRGDLDLAKEFRALDAAFPGRLVFDDHWQTGVNLAFTEQWDAASALLRDAAERFPAQAERLRSFADYVTSVHRALESSTAPPSTIDDNYRGFLERSRPDTPQELFDYAMRTSGMNVYDKTLLALRDARVRLEADPEGDAQLRYLTAFNEVRAWIAVGAYDTAADEFEKLTTQDRVTLDWISSLQVGGDMAKAGARDAARRVLEAGKKRFPEHADRFDRKLSEL